MNIINSAIIVETSNELRKKSLPNYFLENIDSYQTFEDDVLPQSLQDVEKTHIKKVLSFTNNNKTKAAELLGISRVNLIAKAKKYGIE
jgi:transcriptional regulator with PAS, ATPase and Fis domain